MAYKKRVTTKEFTQTTPGAANIVIWRAPYKCTITGIHAYRVAGTGAVVNAQKNGTNLASPDLSVTAATTWMDAVLTGTAATLKFNAGDTLAINVVSVAGAPTQLAVVVDILADANA